MAVQEKAVTDIVALERAPAREMSFTETMTLGKVLFESGYFADVKSAAQAVVKILRGRELGIGPVSALEQVHVIQGKTALGAGLIGALIKRSGRYDYRIVRLDDSCCEIAFFEHGKEIGRSKFTIDDARRADLLSKDTWRKYPRNLLMARALSNGARWYCPDVFGGAIYTPEELREEQVVDVEVAEPVAESTPETEELAEVPASDPKPPAEAGNGDKRKSAICSTIYRLAHKLNVSDELVKAKATEMFFPDRDEPVESLLELSYDQLQQLREHYYQECQRRGLVK